MKIMQWLQQILSAGETQRALDAALANNAKLIKYNTDLLTEKNRLEALKSISHHCCLPPVVADYMKQLVFAGYIHNLYIPLDQPDILGTDDYQTDWGQVYKGIVAILKAALEGEPYPDVVPPPDIEAKWHAGDYNRR